MNLKDKRLEFWNSRASLGIAAGSNDINLKKIEIEAIFEEVRNSKLILDAGCGNATSAITMLRKNKLLNIFAFDYSPQMINEARKCSSSSDLNDRLYLFEGEIQNPSPTILEKLGDSFSGFDCVYTQRALINLDSVEQQQASVSELWKLVAVGGKLILCEAFVDGLKEINNYRKSVGLAQIKSPWHNRYLSLREIYKLGRVLNVKPTIKEFSGTYYFVSRVIYAKECEEAGIEPSYGSTTNQHSLGIAPLPVCGQSKLVVFRKNQP